MTEPVVDISDLAKTFRTHFWSRPVDAVRGISFEIERDEIFGIVGPNGAGKTTTIKMMMNLIFPDDGEVQLFGEPASEASIRRKLGYLPEQPHFYDHLSVTELLAYYGALHGLDRQTVEERTSELLETVGLEDVPDQPIGEFSKGMRQRAGIAQALVNDPELVVLDEPQSGLDPIGRREVRDLIFELRNRGKTVVFSSHILVDVEAVCDRVALLHGGELVDLVDIEELSGGAESDIEISVADLSTSDLDALEFDSLRRSESSGGNLLLSFDADIDLNPVLTELMDAGAEIVGVERRSRRLEEQFMADVGDETDTD